MIIKLCFSHTSFCVLQWCRLTDLNRYLWRLKLHASTVGLRRHISMQLGYLLHGCNFQLQLLYIGLTFRATAPTFCVCSVLHRSNIMVF